MQRVGSPSRNAGASPRSSPAGLGDVTRRYLFFGWLFRKADTADPWSAGAAIRFNIAQGQHLPVYIGRWGCIFLLAMVAGNRFEHAARLIFAAACYLVGVFSLCYVILAGAIFIVLRIASYDRRRAGGPTRLPRTYRP